ncbi:MAG TPA: 3-phosphoserine/phosphohydroxythreonine transaminase [Polyangiaceae bacterium]|jgi:phosphoserine aminotransferase|nr:3-phosphoserine/phosphohydroxythreonine transaminase [Polyangiaceae bacterium]
MARVINFNAGPAALPLGALERAQKELLDIDGSGMSVMEHSHRGKVYEAVHNEAIALVKELLNVSDDYNILLLQGGASQQFAVVPMNLLPQGKSADYIMTGSWSQKAYKEGKVLGTVRVAGTTEKDKKFARVPKQSELELDPNAAYAHITSNNTIFGTQWHEFPNTGSVPLIADMSSDIAWKPIDVSKFGLIYAGAQKNLGPSGLVVVIVRKDLVEAGRKDIPVIFQYRTHVENNSLYNTPPTFSVYMLRNVLAEVKANGGLSAMEKLNREKAALLYSAIESRSDIFDCPVEKDSRSTMNVVFTAKTPELEAEFLAEAKKLKMEGLKGHRSVGGFRASIYNAVSRESVATLAECIKKFKA